MGKTHFKQSIYFYYVNLFKSLFLQSVPPRPLLTDERRFFSRVLKNAQMQGSRGAFHLRQAGNPEK